jgi:hypothetical protein
MMTQPFRLITQVSVAAALIATTIVMTLASATAIAKPDDSNEISCVIRPTGTSLSCNWVKSIVGNDRKSMTPEDISAFIDKAAVQAYITVLSKKKLERTFLVDNNHPAFRRIAELKKSASIGEISHAKLDLFSEIEKKTIKVSADLDEAVAASDLIIADPSVSREKFKTDLHDAAGELDALRDKKDKLCTATPAFEQITRANQHLQKTLSSLVYAFQNPNSCLTDFKLVKDREGEVDLRQLDNIGPQFIEKCRRVSSTQTGDK